VGERPLDKPPVPVRVFAVGENARAWWLSSYPVAAWITEEEAQVPTGIALRDVREQLFDAAERILLRAGPSALTSRAVTTEAGCAKGVLHRHFADFDAFLVEFVLDRIGRMDSQAAALRDMAGTGTVIGNIADALTALFTSAAVAMVSLVSFRDELRARLRDGWPAGVPVLTEAVDLVGGYLAAERELGRVAADAEVDWLAPALIGATHLLFFDRTGLQPDEQAVRKAVSTVIGGIVR
jgi:AcrR family transcriptional regulator